MSFSMLWPAGATRRLRLGQSLKTLVVLPVLVGLLGAPRLAQETPSKPFLEKNSFYMSSAGFRLQLAMNAEGKKALRALPPHRFVVHTLVSRF